MCGRIAINGGEETLPLVKITSGAKFTTKEKDENF
jgi:hypothetical protein